MDFFEKAKAGWIAEEIAQRAYWPMFENDPGDKGIRSIVYGWKLMKADLSPHTSGELN